MANINENFVLFSSDNIYQQHITELLPESIAFVLKKGQEKLITQNNTFYFVPNNGKMGQVLKAREGYFSWDDLYSVRVNNSVGNLYTDDAIQVITLTCTASTQTFDLAFINDFPIGGNCTLYLTSSDTSTDQPKVTLDKSKFISLNDQYEIPLSKGEWVSVYFFCTGGYIYFIIDDLGKDVKNIKDKLNDVYLLKNGADSAGTVNDNSVIMNDTNITKNVYELSIGRYNNSSRGTGSDFAVPNKFNSIFTIGNGLDSSHRHDAFVVGQGGEVKIIDLDSPGEYYEKDTFTLQDKLKEYESDIANLKVQLLEANDMISILTEKLSMLEERLNTCCPQQDEELSDFENENGTD